MKKRIFAASMASVMALSSVSVVAFADETKADYGEAVTKAELKEYVKSFDAFVEDKLDDYGTIQAGWFNDALDAAQVVIDNRDATADDINAAYQMLKAVNDKLAMYTGTQVKELVEECKSDYETENNYNAAFKDEIWKTESFDAFVDAYDRAEAYADDEDPAELNDAYLELDIAHSNLEAKDKVSKSEFRAAYQSYIELRDGNYDYEFWRRGTCSVNATTGGYKDIKGKKLNLTSASYVTFGELYNIVFGSSDAVLWDATKNGRDRGVAEPTKGDSWIKYGDVNGGSTSSVSDYIDKAYKYFLTNAESNVTTDEDIYNAYKSAVEAVKVYKGWTATKVNGSKSVILDDLLDDYRAKFIKNGAADALVTSLGNAVEWNDDHTKLLVKTVASANGILIDKTTKKIVLNDSDNKTYWSNASSNADKKDYVEKLEKKGTFKEGDDITKYIPITPEMISDFAKDAASTAVSDATTAKNVVTDADSILNAYGNNLAALKKAITDLKADTSAATDAAAAVTALKGYVTTVTDAVTAATNITMPTDNTSGYMIAKTAYDAWNEPQYASTNIDATELEELVKLIGLADDYLNAIKNYVNAVKAESQAVVSAGPNLEAYYNCLESAMNMYVDVKALENSDVKDKNFKLLVAKIDENNTVSEKDRSSKAYGLLIKYTTFALDNVFPEDPSPKTLNDIKAVSDKAKDLIDKTGDAVMFKNKNAALVDEREYAINYVAMCRANADFKPNAYTTSVYNWINDAYNDLEEQFAKYPYSYADVAETLSDVAEGLDSKAYGASADAIKAAAADIAFDLSTMDEFKTENNSIYDEDRKFIGYNRLQSDGNDAEKALFKNYEALLKAMEDAAKTEEPGDVIMGDVDGNKVITPNDALAVLKYAAKTIDLTAEQKKAADFNSDGVVNAKDALAILKSLAGIKD